jgi:hypothetical protein
MQRRSSACRSGILKLGDERLRLREVTLRLVDVEFADHAAGELGGDDLQRFGLERFVGFDELDLFLQRTDFDVCLGDVGQQRDEDRVVAFDRGVEIGVGGFDSPAIAAPEVEFPAEVEASLPLIEEAVLQEAGVGRLVAHRVTRVAAGDVLRLREDFADGRRSHGAGPHHSEAGLAEGEVLIDGVGNEGVERGVVEDGPPALETRRLLADAGVAGVDPVGGYRGDRLAVVGADLEAVADVLPHGRTSAGSGEHPCQHRRSAKSPTHRSNVPPETSSTGGCRATTCRGSRR